MAGCGDIAIVDGATILNSIINGSQFNSGIVTGSTLKFCTLEQLAGVDESSAQTIATAIAALPDNILEPLANKLLHALGTTIGNDPNYTVGTLLPTTVVGERSKLLGAPKAWVQTGAGVTPVYEPI